MPSQKEKWTVGPYRFEAVRTPAEALTQIELEQLTPTLTAVARAAFGVSQITDSDVFLHAIQVEAAIYVWHGGKPIGFSSAASIALASNTDVCYLEGTALLPEFQGVGLYPCITALRVLLWGAESQFIATRTQNALVCKNLADLQPYPIFTHSQQFQRTAQQLAHIIYTQMSDYRRPDGLRFEPHTGVFREAYEGAMNPDRTLTGHAQLDRTMELLDVSRGDALLLVAPTNLPILRRMLTSSIARMGYANPFNLAFHDGTP